VADISERVVAVCLVIECLASLAAGEGVGVEPVLLDDDRVDRLRAEVLDETAELVGELNVGELAGAGSRGLNRLRP
jgi:hypothetical protein